MTTTIITRHAEVIAGLAAFAGFLTDHPDLPLGRFSPFRYSLRHGSTEASHAEVDRIAVILGTAPKTGDDGTYSVTRDFGGRVTYEAFALGTEQDRTRARLTGWIKDEGITGNYPPEGIASRLVAAINPAYISAWLDQGGTPYLRDRCERIRDAADLTGAEHAAARSGRVIFAEGAFAGIAGAA